MGYNNYFVVDRMDRSGGVAIMWKKSANCSVMNYSQNNINVVFNERNVETWRLSCFYGLPERSRRKKS